MDRDRLLLALALALLGTNLLAFAAYGLDKRRAAAGGPRLRERTLILLGAPGPLGAWAGVWVLRHKTRKPWFLLRLLLASALLPAGAAAAWLYSAW